MGLRLFDCADQRELVEQVARDQRDAVEDVLDALVVGGGLATGEAKDFVAFVEQEFCEVGTGLASDTGDERAACRHAPNSLPR